MNKTQPNLPEVALISEVSDADMLKYLIRECGKTKDELALEIKERFWMVDNFTNYLNKPLE